MMKRTLLSLFCLICFSSIAQDFEELIKVVSSDRSEEDRLGWAVDIDTDFAIVGAYADDFGTTNPNMGSAYIYQKIGDDWVEIQKLSNADQDDYDRFGWSVAIDDGVAVIGAYGEDHNALDGEYLSKAGAAYIFERGVDGIWTEIEKIVASDRVANDEFGWSVEVSGNTVIVGSHIDDKDQNGLGYLYHAGSAYIFDKGTDGTWTETQKIVAPDRTMGTEFADDHEDWNDRFGEDVAIWGDYIAVTGYFINNAYLFERSSTGLWEINSLLSFPGIGSFDRPSAIAIDSTTVILGAQTEDMDEFGTEYIMNSGGAAVFKRTEGDIWTFSQKLSPSDRDAGDHYGISTDISGNYIVIGVHSDNEDENNDNELDNAGSAYIYELQADGSYLETQKIVASDRAINDELGISVGISGNTIITGAFQQSEIEGGGSYLEDAGAAYFFTNGPSEPVCDDVFYAQNILLCTGETVTVGINVYFESGVYTDVFPMGDGCDSIVLSTVTFHPPMNLGISSPGDGTLTAVQSDVSYQWVNCSTISPIEGATNQTFVPSENGTYTVILTSPTCAETPDCVTITYLDIENQVNKTAIAVYPNPNNGSFIVYGEEIITGQLTLYNSIGKLIYRSKINTQKTIVDLTGITPGMYMLHITTEKGTKIEKLQIQ